MNSFIVENFSIPFAYPIGHVEYQSKLDEYMSKVQAKMPILTKVNSTGSDLGLYGFCVFSVEIDGKRFVAVEQPKVLNPNGSKILQSFDVYDSDIYHLFIDLHNMLKQVKLFQLYHYAKQIGRAETDTVYWKFWQWRLKCGRINEHGSLQLPAGIHKVTPDGAQMVKVGHSSGEELFVPDGTYVSIVNSFEDGSVTCRPTAERLNQGGDFPTHSVLFFYKPETGYNPERDHFEKFIFTSNEPIEEYDFWAITVKFGMRPNFTTNCEIGKLVSAVFDNDIEYPGPKLTAQWNIMCIPQILCDDAPIIQTDDIPTRFLSQPEPVLFNTTSAASASSSNGTGWNLVNFLSSIDLLQYYQNFVDEEVTAVQDIKDLSVEDLKILGITKIGDKNRFLRAVKRL